MGVGPKSTSEMTLAVNRLRSMPERSLHSIHSAPPVPRPGIIKVTEIGTISFQSVNLCECIDFLGTSRDGKSKALESIEGRSSTGLDFNDVIIRDSTIHGG